MRAYKSSIKLFFACSLAIAVLVPLVNYVVDPFQQYRKASLYQTVYMAGTERYLNAGLAKTYTYDSVVIGTSMTQNFVLSEVSQYLDFSRPIKLTTAGGSMFEEITMLNTAIASGQVEQVLFGLDLFSLDVGQTDENFPMYLYDSELLNDYFYLFNLDTLKRSMLYLWIPLFVDENHPRMNYDRMYQWQHLYPQSFFDENKIIADWKAVQTEHSIKIEGYSYTLATMKSNFDQILFPVVRDNPQIQFSFFFPPYSVLTYKLADSYGRMDGFIDMKRYIFEQFQGLPNVELHDFQSADQITHDLNNYMDISHYHQRVNSWILSEMAVGEYRLTLDNVDEFETRLRMQTQQYQLPSGME